MNKMDRIVRPEKACVAGVKVPQVQRLEPLEFGTKGPESNASGEGVILSGTPQGGIVSPVLANIYLH
jgi:hypothetical protein